MDKEMYAQLRTVEQLGYIVAAVETKKWGVCGLKCLVQSVQCPQVRWFYPRARSLTHRAQHLEVRMENFFKYFEDKLVSSGQAGS
eukprot:679914-Hanusia_phi.AAC.3